MFINQMKLKNFRCFKDQQIIRLAPLTLLMGENSAGKTSLMAILRILMNTVHGRDPNFNEDPYNLGTLSEIIHYQNSKKQISSNDFEAGFAFTDNKNTINIDITFGKKDPKSISPYPVKEKLSHQVKKDWIESDFRSKELKFSIRDRVWKNTKHFIDKVKIDKAKKDEQTVMQKLLTELTLFDFLGVLWGPIPPEIIKWTSLSKYKNPSKEDFKNLHQFISIARKFLNHRRHPYASAPVRSKPKRTYNPTQLIRDSEGANIPMYLAEISLKDPQKWKALKKSLETFGKEAGLFNEIFVKRFEKTGSGPFQIQIKHAKGPKRNLIDMGYGVSQVLPVITELLMKNVPSVSLLQQPEVHLHPSAQAALGSLFCQIASDKKTQLLIETHSDHLMDRIIMDIRDKKNKLRPEDVSILFFERKGLEVNIHSIKIDKNGNVLNAPESYRQFFMDETNRSLGI